MPTATLRVDLSALCENYRTLRARHAKNNISAVVKANAYGLGVDAVSRALWQEGCREFFVATLAEGVELRAILPDASIGVFSGIFAGEEKEFSQHNLLPVINDLEMAERALTHAPDHPIILHYDTGMTRLGLSEPELKRFAASYKPKNLLLMSHLACANESDHAKNAEQLARFNGALELLPHARTSLANSSGHFLPPAFHFDLGRPGCALYGINPVQGKNPMRHVATLSAPLLQVRTLDRDETVGYGAQYAAKKSGRIAITALGYADGYFRSMSNIGIAYIGEHKAPIAGRVSMDMIALDVSDIPDSLLTGDVRAEFIGEQQPVDVIANAAHTIGYEIFTRIGKRVQRIYA